MQQRPALCVQHLKQFLHIWTYHASIHQQHSSPHHLSTVSVHDHRQL